MFKLKTTPLTNTKIEVSSNLCENQTFDSYLEVLDFLRQLFKEESLPFNNDAVSAYVQLIVYTRDNEKDINNLDELTFLVENEEY